MRPSILKRVSQVAEAPLTVRRPIDTARNGMKIRLVLAGLISLFFIQVAPGEGAELRYIRIGEHKAYTRIVFEFRGAAIFKEPVVQGKGAFSVVFENTNTALPEQIASETSKRVGLIRFVQEESHLAANITVTFPYFDIKAFALQNPDRVVLDVNPLSEPPPGVVFEEKLEKASTAEPVSATPENPGMESGKEAKTDVENSAVQTIATGGAISPERPIAAEPNTPAQVLAPPPQADTIPTTNTGAAVAVHPVGPEAVEDAESPPASPVAPLPAQATGGGLQTMLLVVLLGVSVVIVGLLSVLIFRKRQVAESKEGLVERRDDRDDSIKAIDARLRKALSRIG